MSCPIAVGVFFALSLLTLVFAVRATATFEPSPPPKGSPMHPTPPVGPEVHARQAFWGRR